MPGSAHPKRSRYYSAVLDVKNLKRGDKYNSLRPSYIIFICQFDYFNQDEAVYVFERADLKKSLPMGDESYTIVVNTKSEKGIAAAIKKLALSMKANGRPLIQIAQDTGLSVMEIEAL